MKLKSLFIVLTLGAVALWCRASRLVVVGSDDGQPVAGATVMSETGQILCVSDNNGVASLPDAAGYPLTLRSLGFDVKTITEPSDTVILQSVDCELPEISVDAFGRPIRRILCYAREYSTGTTGSDTMQLYSEYMFEAFLTDRKVKGYHSSDSNLKTRALNRYARLSGKDFRDTVFMPAADNDISLLAWADCFCELPKEKVEETIAIRNGAIIDSIAGKYRTAKMLQKSARRYSVINDGLSDHKDCCWSPTLFKIFGMTIDISQYKTATSYRANDKGVYDIYDMMYMSLNLDVLARGKMFKWLFRSKEPLRMGSNIELYPVDITFLTIDEYKEMRKDKSPLDFILPQNPLPEIPAAVAIKNCVLTQVNERDGEPL